MFCNKCGNQLRDGAKFCNICGKPVAEVSDNYLTHNEPKSSSSETNPSYSSSSGVASQKTPPTEHQFGGYQPQPAVQYQQQAYQLQSRPYYAPGTHPYHRLGGFLMFIVVGSYISGVGAFISIISTIITYASLLSMSKWFPGGFTACLVFAMIGAIILDIITGAVIISYANQIRRKEPGFLHFIQSASITIMIIGSVYYLVVLLWMKSFDRYGAISSGSIFGILIAMAIAWVLGLIFGSVYFGCSVRVRTYMGSDAYLKQSVFNKNSHPIPADGSDQPGVTQSNQANSYNPQRQWFCMACGRINENTTGICACGNTIPSRDLSKSWICNNCGRYNNDDSDVCYLCGHKRYPDLILTDWICSECGGRNIQSAKECKVCCTPKPGTGTNIRQKNR